MPRTGERYSETENPGWWKLNGKKVIGSTIGLIAGVAILALLSYFLWPFILASGFTLLFGYGALVTFPFISTQAALIIGGGTFVALFGLPFAALCGKLGGNIAGFFGKETFDANKGMPEATNWQRYGADTVGSATGIVSSALLFGGLGFAMTLIAVGTITLPVVGWLVGGLLVASLITIGLTAAATKSAKACCAADIKTQEASENSSNDEKFADTSKLNVVNVASTTINSVQQPTSSESTPLLQPIYRDSHKPGLWQGAPQSGQSPRASSAPLRNARW